MARAKFRFRPTVGRHRVSQHISGTQTASYTRQARAQMAEVIKNYENLIRHIEEITPELLLEALEPTFELSQEYCPKDTGALVASGYLEIREFRGRARVDMGYGRGGIPDYAAAVHENMEWRHKAPTRAKWLQVALSEDSANIEERIISGYREVF